jgi:hypothetical protein
MGLYADTKIYTTRRDVSVDRLIDFFGLVMIYLLGAWSGVVTIALVQAARRDEDFEEELETRSRDSESEK